MDDLIKQAIEMGKHRYSLIVKKYQEDQKKKEHDEIKELKLMWGDNNENKS